MAWMTTEEIKSYLNITDATYDTDIDKYNPVAEDRLNSYLNKHLEDLPLGYEPAYSRLVWLFIAEAGTSTNGGNVKSQSFDGQSITYGDFTVYDISSTSNQQLSKFNPLRKKYW